MGNSKTMLRNLTSYIALILVTFSCNSSKDNYPLENTGGTAIHPELFDKDETEIRDLKFRPKKDSTKKDSVKLYYDSIMGNEKTYYILIDSIKPDSTK